MAGFTQLTFTGTVPTTAAQDIIPSPDRKYIVVLLALTMMIYKQNASNPNQYDWIETKSTGVNNAQRGVWSNNGNFFALLRNASNAWLPVFSVNRTTDAFTQVNTNISGYASPQYARMGLSPDDKVIVVPRGNTIPVTAWAFDPATGAVTQTQTTVPHNLGSVVGRGVAWSGNDMILITNSLAFNIFRWNGSSFTRLTVAGGNFVTSLPTDVTASENGNYFIVSHAGAPWISIVEKDASNNWTRKALTISSGVPTVQVQTVAFFAKDTLLMAGLLQDGDNMRFYSFDKDTLTLAQVSRSDVSNNLPFRPNGLHFNSARSVYSIAGNASPGIIAWDWALPGATVNSVIRTPKFRMAATGKRVNKSRSGALRLKPFKEAGLVNVDVGVLGQPKTTKFKTASYVNIDAAPVVEDTPWTQMRALALMESEPPTVTIGPPDHPFVFADVNLVKFKTDGLAKFPIEVYGDCFIRWARIAGQINVPLENTVIARLPAFTSDGEVFVDRTRTVEGEPLLPTFTTDGFVYLPIILEDEDTKLPKFTTTGQVNVDFGGEAVITLPKFFTYAYGLVPTAVLGEPRLPMFKTDGLVFWTIETSAIEAVLPKFTTDGLIGIAPQVTGDGLMKRFTTDGFVAVPYLLDFQLNLPKFTTDGLAFLPITGESEIILPGFQTDGFLRPPITVDSNIRLKPIRATITAELNPAAFAVCRLKPFWASGSINVKPKGGIEAELTTPGFESDANLRLRSRIRKVRTIMPS